MQAPKRDIRIQLLDVRPDTLVEVKPLNIENGKLSAVNISSNGLFLSGDALRSANDRGIRDLDLLIKIPETDFEVRAKGEIRWHRDHDNGALSPPGAGVNLSIANATETVTWLTYRRNEP